MPTQTPTQFARRVRAELNRQDLTVRGLARKIDPSQVERARRNLHRWLDDGIAPHPNSRVEVARALGLEENALDDDEEDHLQFGLAIQRMFDVAVDRAVDRRLGPLLKERA